MHTLTYRTASATMACISVAVLAAGCSSSKGSSSSTGATTPSSTGATAATSSASAGGAVAAGTAVTATEQEFSIALSAKSFTAGSYTFTVHNAGKFPHNLTIEGPGVDKKASPTLPGGGTGTVAVTLVKGSYELWCSVDSHKEKGMDMKITVA